MPVPATKSNGKLASRARPTRYLLPTDPTYVTVLHTDIKEGAQYRLIDFNTVYPDLKPTTSIRRSFKTICHATTPGATPDTPPTTSTTRARPYTDATEWTVAHDSELYQLDTQNEIKWLKHADVPLRCRPVSLTMTYEYILCTYGSVEKQKGR